MSNSYEQQGLAKRINYSIIGGGSLVIGLLKQSNPKFSNINSSGEPFIETIHLFTESARECNPSYPTSLSYDKIRLLSGFDTPLQVKLKTYQNIEDWAVATKNESTAVVFATGPHVIDYCSGDRNNREENERFNRFLFETTLPKNLRVSTALGNAGYDGFFLQISNPIASNSIITKIFSGLYPFKIISPTPDGIRGAKILCDDLNIRGLGKKFGVNRISLDDIIGAPIVNVHDKPHPMIRDWKIRLKNEIFSLGDPRLWELKPSYSHSLQKRIMEKAKNTMVASKDQNSDYIEIQQSVMMLLKAIAFGEQPDPIVSCSSYSEKLDSFIMSPVVYDPKNEIFTQNLDFKSLSKNIRDEINFYSENQWRLIEDYLGRYFVKSHRKIKRPKSSIKKSTKRSITEYVGEN